MLYQLSYTPIRRSAADGEVDFAPALRKGRAAAPQSVGRTSITMSPAFSVFDWVRQKP